MDTRFMKAAGACAVIAMALPGAAIARGGGGGGAAPAANCTTATPLNSGVTDKPASGKPITIDLKITNCTAAGRTVATTLIATSTTVRSNDPYVVETCSTTPYAAQQLTLKPGESRSIAAAAQLPFCGYSPWGVTASYVVAYDATASDAADGAVLGTATSYVQHSGGA